MAADWLATLEPGATILLELAPASEHASEEVYAQHESDLAVALAAAMTAAALLLDEHDVHVAIRPQLAGWAVTREEAPTAPTPCVLRSLGGPTE
jgi:hypothetical protein